MLCITPKVTFDSVWFFFFSLLIWQILKEVPFFCFLSGLHLNQLSVLGVVWQCQLSCARRRASWATEGRADACACAPSAGPAPRQSSRQCGWPWELQTVGLGAAAGGDRAWPWCSVSGIGVCLQNVGHWGLVRVCRQNGASLHSEAGQTSPASAVNFGSKLLSRRHLLQE